MKKCFYNNLDIRGLLAYFYFVLIVLISDYKNIFSHNVCMMVFMKIFSMHIVNM